MESMTAMTNYEKFIERPLNDFLGLTRKQIQVLQELGVKTFADFLQLEVGDCMLAESVKSVLKSRQEDLRKQAESERLSDFSQKPMQPLEIPVQRKARVDLRARADSPGLETSRVQESEAMALGWTWDPKRQLPMSDNPEAIALPFDSLRRHVFIAGGTGSGKTVLAKVILEEAAANGIPSIVIDPAGDLAQLSVQLPFSPNEAERVSCATKMAKIHDNGAAVEQALGKWASILETHFRLQEASGLDEGIVERTRMRVCVRLFAPITEDKGLKLALPAFDPQVLSRLTEESEGDYHGRIALSLQELVSVLGLTGHKGERVATVLTSLIERHPGRFCTTDPLGKLRSAFDNLSTLLPDIQGMSVDAYIEDRVRLEFQRAVVTYQAGAGRSWLNGTDFDLDLLMKSDKGHTPINVISLQHLAPEDQQRAVARIVSRVDHWMRNTPSASSGVRGIVYLDELGGGGGKQAFFPPVARPVSKPPLMRLVRQARKYGVGVVLATQNMRDIDYQGLANINSWFVGKINNTRETSYIAAGMAQATMARGQITGHEISRHLPALPPGHFLHVDDRGKPLLMRGRYLSSLHCSPDLVQGVYEGWEREHSEICEECAAAFLSDTRLDVPSIRVTPSPVFVERLVAQLQADPQSHANALACLTWVIENHQKFCQQAEDIVRQQTVSIEPEKALAWIDAVINLKATSLRTKSDLESRRLAILMEQGGTAVSLRPGDVLAEPRRSWWEKLLDAATSWCLTGEDMQQAKILRGTTALTVESRDIEQIDFGIGQSRRNVVRKVTERIEKECEDIPYDIAVEWYRGAVEGFAGLEEADVKPEHQTILQAMYARPLNASEHFQLAERVKTELRAMDAIDFEYYTADILRQRGIEANVTRASGDEGVDVFAIGPDGKRCAVQCKRYSRPVGPGVVRELDGSRRLHKCDTALLVTTTSLTAGAAEAAEQLGIDVMDGNHLAALHLERR